MGATEDYNKNNLESIAVNGDFFYDPIDNNRKIRANGAIIVSDIHGNYNSLNKVYSIAKNNNNAVVINGDLVNDYHFQEYARDMGYKSQQELFFEHALDKLGEKDFQTLYFARNYHQFQSLDPFLEQVPDEHRNEAKKHLEEILNYSKSEMFQKKFEKTVNSFKEEKEEIVIYNQIRLNALYQVFMDEEAKKLAQTINSYGVDTLFNLGNHENAFFVKQVRQYLDDPTKITDVANHRGYITLEQENGSKITLAGMTNCVQTMPYLQDVISSEEDFNFLTYHMGIDEIKSKTLLQGAANEEHFNSLEDLIKQDSDYKRIFQNGEQNLDVFLTHGQVGEVLMNNGQGYDVPYFGIAAYLSNLADYTVEGHIHSKYDGINSFGNKMIRAAGEDAAILTKDTEGNLQKEWIRIDNNFNGNHNNPIQYSKDEMYRKVEELAKEIEAQYNLKLPNGSYDSKAT